MKQVQNIVELLLRARCHLPEILGRHLDTALGDDGRNRHGGQAARFQRAIHLAVELTVTGRQVAMADIEILRRRFKAVFEEQRADLIV